MSNKISKKVITVAVLTVLLVMSLVFCACQNDDDTQSGNVIPQYDTLGYRSFEIAEFRGYGGLKNWNYEDKVEIETITSVAELEEFDMCVLNNIGDVFFENNVCIFIKFRYTDGEDNNVEFINFAIKDGKFYPIFALTSLPPYAASTGMLGENFYLIQANKKILDYEFAEILVIDRRDINHGSSKYKSITSVFN